MYTPRRSEILWPYSLVEEESSRKFYASSPRRAKPGKLPQRVARDAALNPDGEWNEYEIRVETDRIIVFLNGVKINEWVDDPNIDLARIGIAQRAVGTPLSEDESAGDARCMHGADGRNRYNDEGRASGKGVVYISSERVGAWLIEAGVVGASVPAAREVRSFASRYQTPPCRGFRARRGA